MKIFNVKTILLGGMILNTFPAIALDQQVMQQRAREAKAWVISNKNKIITFGIAALALLGAAYGVSSSTKLHVIEVFKEKKVALPDDQETRNALYRLGLLAAEKGIEGLKELIQTSIDPQGVDQFTIMLRTYTNLDKALAELAGVSVSNINKLKNS